MSQRNLEIVRRFIEALDGEAFDDAMSCLDDDAQWHNTTAFPETRTLVGPKAIIGFWQWLGEAFESADTGIDAERLTAGHDCVVAGVRSRGRGARSDIPMDVRYALSFSLRANKIVRVDVYGDFDKALEATGLRE